jgi:uncharacterized delta-60 repeat protein
MRAERYHCFNDRDRTLRRVRKQLFACVVFAAVIFSPSLFAQDGQLDPTFGSGGRKVVRVSAMNRDNAEVVRITSDGKILLGGTCGTIGVDSQFCLTRLKSDGSYDTTFGPLGLGYVDFGDLPNWRPQSELTSMELLADGRIALGGSPEYTDEQIVAIMKADGSGLDTSVGGGRGYQIFVFRQTGATSGYASSSVQVQPDGKLLAYGVAFNTSEDWGVVRFLPDLTFDTTFGDNGYQTIAFDLDGPGGKNNDVPQAMALQSDGKIVIGGLGSFLPSGATTYSYAFELCRLLSTGQRDPAFGPNGDGRVFYNVGTSDAINDIAIDPYDRIVIGGRIDNAGAVDRRLADGSIDPFFNGGEPQTFGSLLPGLQQVYRVVATSDGILAGGTVIDSVDYFGVARLNHDGTFDSSFGISGYTAGQYGTGASETDNLLGMALSDQGIVVTGPATQIVGGKAQVGFGVARLQYDHIFESSFE